MRFKLSFREWWTLRISVEKALELDNELRRFGKTWFTKEENGGVHEIRKDVENIKKRIEILPKRTKAGLKSILTKQGMSKERQKKEWPWLFSDSFYPNEMGLNIEMNEWLALEQALCLAYEYEVENSIFSDCQRVEETFTDRGIEVLKSLLNRIQLLPRRSKAGYRALATKLDIDTEIEQTVDYRDSEYHSSGIVSLDDIKREE